jgi:hypothetical protein
MDSDKDSGKEIVVIGIFRKTRKRIKVNAAKSGKKMNEYVESIIPDEESVSG